MITTDFSGEKRNAVGIIYLDFSKAFDMVSHKLLENLKKIGINRKIVKWPGTD